jgi:hypothetical protein
MHIINRFTTLLAISATIKKIPPFISVLAQPSRLSLSLRTVTLPKIHSFKHGCMKTSRQMKKGMSTLRKELNDIEYLESHTQVCQMFKDVGCYNFCQKLKIFHQQVAKAFALIFYGKKAIIGRDELEINEAIISEVTELPTTREKRFKTTVIKNVEFRSYLKPEHRGLIWKKDIPVSFIEEKWK